MDDICATVYVASCQYPPDILRERTAYKSLNKLRLDITAGDSPERRKYLLMAGDAVYVDATAGLVDPEDPQGRFDEPYKRMFELAEWEEIRANAVVYHCMDDHEIHENFEVASDLLFPDEVIKAKRRFFKYCYPDRLAPDQYHCPQTVADTPLWMPDLALNGLPFFLMDTRTERAPRKATTPLASHMIGASQRAALGEFLSQARGMQSVPKIIMSPSILLPRTLAAAQAGGPGSGHPIMADSWEGYPATFIWLVRTIAKYECGNVVFVSGDEHLSCLATITVQRAGGQPTKFHSIHSSALNAPYPFANSKVEDFSASETFEIEPDDSFTDAVTVTVDTQFPDKGDGYAKLLFDITATGNGASVEFLGRYGRETFNLVLDQPGHSYS